MRHLYRGDLVLEIQLLLLELMEKHFVAGRSALFLRDPAGQLGMFGLKGRQMAVIHFVILSLQRDPSPSHKPE